MARYRVYFERVEVRWVDVDAEDEEDAEELADRSFYRTDGGWRLVESEVLSDP